jgi:phospholipid transport system transporter-binding protein
VNATADAGVLRLSGALDFESLPGVIAEADRYVARGDIPDRLTIDFSDVAAVDSSAVALLLEWRRRAQERKVALHFQNLPPNLLALAELYGVKELIQSERPGPGP